MGTRGPLTGIKVVDVSEVISGPLGAMILADQGADVIKVEPLPWGEESRMLINYRNGMAALALNCNHNKRSIGLNLKKPEGHAVLLDLVRDADVFIQNWRPGAAERLGVAEADLRKVNPNLVYASITGYGDDGPYADRRGYDPIFQAMSGWVHSQLNPEVPFPDLVRNAVVDKATSLTLAQGVTAALLARAMGGPPQHVRVAMLDVALSMLWPDGMLRHSLIPSSDDPDSKEYDVQDHVVPGERYQVNRTADGHVVLWAGTTQQQRDTLIALGHPELAASPEQRGMAAARPENVAARVTATLESLADMTTQEVVQALTDHQVPVAAVASIEDVFNDPQYRHNGSIVEDEHAQYGRYRRAHPAARFSEAPYEHVQHPPLFDEHAQEILEGLGYDTSKIDALRASEAISPAK